MDARRRTKLRADPTAFLDDAAGALDHPRRREWCDAYLRGVLLDGHRKTVEPRAARLNAIERGSGGYERALQQFLDQSPWDEPTVLDGLRAWVAGRFGTDGVLILDDTGCPKQGERPVGVARPYPGTLGTIAGCQVAVTLPFAAATQVVAPDARLYPPEAGAADGDRPAKAGVPDGAGDRPKWASARDTVRRAAAHGFRGAVLADSLFGTVTAFRERLAAGGRTYCVGIDSTLEVIAADADLGPIPGRPRAGRPPARPAKVRRGATPPSVRGWALDRESDSRPVTRREGSEGRVSGRFAARRVRPAHRLSAGKVPPGPCGLLAEWPGDADRPTKYFFGNLPPATSLKRPVAAAESRGWIEHSYRELKDELGLDHFEGRSWLGWHHRVVLVLMGYAFLQDVRRRRPQKGPPG